jgi:hypothetical protein
VRPQPGKTHNFPIRLDFYSVNMAGWNVMLKKLIAALFGVVFALAFITPRGRRCATRLAPHAHTTGHSATNIARKAERAVALDTGAVVAVTL